MVDLMGETITKTKERSNAAKNAWNEVVQSEKEMMEKYQVKNKEIIYLEIFLLDLNTIMCSSVFTVNYEKCHSY